MHNKLRRRRRVRAQLAEPPTAAAMSSSRPYRQLSEETEPSASASTASIAFHLMYESAQHLEARGDRVAAAELLARALAEEAQRINQAEQSALDLSLIHI